MMTIDREEAFRVVAVRNNLDLIKRESKRGAAAETVSF